MEEKPSVTLAALEDKEGKKSRKKTPGKKHRSNVTLTLLRKNFLLKRRALLGTCCEFLLPLLFVVLFASLKGLTDKVRIEDGWSLTNQNRCAFEVAEDGFNKTCAYPYSRFGKMPTSFSQISSSFKGSWTGHETAKLFLATSTSDEETKEGLRMFVNWMTVNGGIEGPFEDFENYTFVLGDGTVEELNAYVASEDYGNPSFTEQTPECAAAIVFDKFDLKKVQFEYTIRMNSTGSAQRFEVTRTTRNPTNDIQRSLWWSGGSPNVEYLESGFITIQQLLDNFIISMAGENTTGFPAYEDNLYVPVDTIDFSVFEPYGGMFYPFPIKGYNWDEFFFYVTEVFPLVFTLVYLYPVARILQNLVREKETRMTEMLKMMGVEEVQIIWSWYLTYGIFFFVLALIITFLSRNMLPSTFEAAGGFSTFTFFLFFLFGLATIAFCFTLSTTFQKARTASFVGVIIYFVGFFFYYSVNTVEVNPKPFAALLLPQVSFSLLLQTIAIMESSGVGASLKTWEEDIQGFNLRYGIIMLIVDIFFWTLVGLYLSAVLPREFGQRLPWYFPFQPSYWRNKLACLRKNRVDGEFSMVDVESEPADQNENVESVDPSLRRQISQHRGIQIRNLRKEFSTPSGKKVAVDNLSMDIFEGQIFALLGHNGAGKTTTISLLSGMLPVTKGDAFIQGLSIKNQMNDIRRSLGFCPQHDVLYGELTVFEHLRFYGRLKGLYGKDLENAMEDAVRQVGLVEKRHVKSNALSGGMKRKLSVAIALIGDSKIVFVDEPTSGVDPYSRRSIWEVLQNNRDGRVIVLTTHFMDEADLLGDRIAIMAEGKLKCCGSSLFLKNRYGAGYVLTMVKTKSCDVDRLTALVRKHVQAARLVTNVGTEVSFQLPLNSSSSFPALFKQVDDELNSIGILSYGISVTSLEQVFLKVARADDQREGTDSGHFSATDGKGVELYDKDGNPIKAEALNTLTDTEQVATPSAVGLFFLHYGAMLKKRVQYSKRDGRSFLCSVIMPIVLYLVGLLVLRFIPIGNDDPAYVLNTVDFNPTFPAEKRAFLPVIEFNQEGLVNFSVAEQLKFDPFFQLERLEGFAPPDPDQVVKVFTREYKNGLPLEEDCSKVECVNPTPLHGAALLNFSESMINSPVDRDGASLYAAAIVQPMPAVLPHSCLLTNFEFDLEQGTSFLTYEATPCSSPDSECLFLESRFEDPTGDDRIVCLSAGCKSNLYEDGQIDRLIATAGFGTGGGGGGGGGAQISPEEQAEFEELVENTRILSCFGSLCNTGPSTAFEPSVCRDSSQTCIADGLFAYKINITDFSLYVEPGLPYCDGRNISSEEDIQAAGALSTGFQGGTPPPPGLGNSTEGPRECMVSDIPQVAQRIALDFLTQSFNGGNGTANLTLADSFDEANNACVDTLRPCSFLWLPGGGVNGSNVCLVDSCVDNDNTTLPLLEALIPELSNATRKSCTDVPTDCDQVFDLAAFQGLNQEGTVLDLLNLTTSNLFGLQLNTSFVEGLVGALFPQGNTTALIEAIGDVQQIIDASNGTTIDAGALLGLILASQNTNLINVIDAISENLNLTDINSILNSFFVGDGLTLDTILNNPELREFFLDSLTEISTAGSTPVLCANPLDQCAIADVNLLGQKLCVPMGCSSEFTPGGYAWLPLLSVDPANPTGTTGDVEDINFFQCNITQCNYGCRAGGNCEKEDLEESRFNATTGEFYEFEFCPATPIRYSYTLLINSTTIHGTAVVANSIHNALLRTKMFAKHPEYYADVLSGQTTTKSIPTIVAKTQPLPLTNNLKTIISGILAFIAAIFAMIAFAFVPASTASYVVLEREAHANVKHQQMVSGAGIFSYWFSLYTFDMVLFLVPLLGAIVLIYAFDISSYIENDAIFATILVFYGFGLAGIAFSYLTSNFFKEHTSALIGTLFINLLTGLVLMIASYVMSSLDNQSVVETNANLKPFYRLFPGFCLGDSLLNMAILKILTGIAGPIFETPNVFDWDQTGANIVYLYIEAVVFFGLVLLIELVKFYPALYKFVSRDPKVKDPPYELDDDVEAEEERVLSGEADKSGDAIVIERLRKVYKGKKVAVRNVSIGIPEGEIFGYLGINGAGKTTSINCMTGKTVPSSGTARLCGHDILKDARATKSLIGFCPQFDALLPLLTVREHLELFGKIKGLRGSILAQAVQELMVKMTLTPFEDKLARSLSGGNKRKLSLAIAAIGAPRILFADEPSTGMDPVSRRFMWDVLQKLASGEFSGKKTTVLLTTHSMEECEALCQRIGIMVGGRMRCIGSGQHLKNKFGKGLLCEMKMSLPSQSRTEDIISKHSDLPEVVTEENLELVGQILGSPERMALVAGRDDAAWLVFNHMDNHGEISMQSFLEWWLVEESFEEIQAFLKDRFPGTTLMERHETQLRFNLPSAKLSKVFETIESNKGKFGIVEYGVSNPTIENVFNFFAVQQEEETGKARGVNFG